MNKLKYPIFGFFLLGLIGVGFGLDLWFMPHRDVQSAPVFDELTADDFINEYLDNAAEANEKYLAADGDSKIIAITGTVSSVETNEAGDAVIYIKGSSDEVAIRCTLMDTEKDEASSVKEGQTLTINGVVSAGAAYDADFEMYEDAIMRECYIE